MSAKEIYYNIRTIWEWSEEFNAIIEDKCREIGDRYGTEVEYIKDKQSFDIKGTDYNTLDQSRDDLIRLLNSKATAAKQSLVIPRRPKKNKSKAEKVNVAPGLPPPSPFVEEDIPLMTTRQTVDDTENLEDIFEFDPRVRMDDIPNIFGWNRREPFLTFDYWMDVCKDCKVSGDIHEDKRRIEFTKGKEKNVKEAKKKIKQLQDNFLRQKLNHKRIPLVHYPNQYTVFKLYFCHLFKHPYFSKTMNMDFQDIYVLVAATLDPLTQKYLLPRDIPDTNSYYNDQYDRIEHNRQENNREEERASKGKAKAGSSTNNYYDSSSHNWKKIPRPSEEREQWSYNVPDTNSSDVFPALSSQSGTRNQNRRPNNFERPLPPERRLENQRARSSFNEDSLIDLDGEPPVVKRSIRQQNPNRSNYSNAGSKTIGKMVRDYNFSKMEDVLKEGLEYVRVHKGEIRFYGSLGKTFFSNVGDDIKGKLWEFTDLKDVLVSGYGVKPKFREIATYDNKLIGGFIEVLGSNPVNKSKSAYYEILAEARNAPQDKVSNVYMYLNMGFVSLEKVMLNWDPLVNIDWTILDRKTDFSMILATRRAIRHDVRPFSTFVKKVSVSPESRAISYENVMFPKTGDMALEVKSINFKQVSKFQLHYPFVAEVARVEKLKIVEQPNSNKHTGKTGFGNIHYTIEIYNEAHREAFKKNSSLGSGEIASWTVDSILGENPQRSILVEFVKTMLLLVERCHKVAELKSQQAEENQ